MSTDNPASSQVHPDMALPSKPVTDKQYAYDFHVKRNQQLRANDSGLNLDHLEALMASADSLSPASSIELAVEVRNALPELIALARRAALANQPAPTDWQAAHADMVKRNALLRERPDLPVDRIPAHAELVRLQEENARLRANQPAPTVPAGRLQGMLPMEILKRCIADEKSVWSNEDRNAIGFALDSLLSRFKVQTERMTTDKEVVNSAHQPAQEQAEPVAWRRATKHGWEYRTNAPTASTPGAGWLPLVDLAAQQEPVAAPQQAAAPCQHINTTARYTHVLCDDCGSVKTDDGWGIASNRWFKSQDEADFYRKHGRLPEGQRTT